MLNSVENYETTNTTARLCNLFRMWELTLVILMTPLKMGNGIKSRAGHVGPIQGATRLLQRLLTADGLHDPALNFRFKWLQRVPEMGAKLHLVCGYLCAYFWTLCDHMQCAPKTNFLQLAICAITKLSFKTYYSIAPIQKNTFSWTSWVVTTKKLAMRLTSMGPVGLHLRFVWFAQNRPP